MSVPYLGAESAISRTCLGNSVVNFSAKGFHVPKARTMFNSLRFLSVHICDPPPRNESQCAKPTFAVARNFLQGCENVDFEILVVTA